MPARIPCNEIFRTCSELDRQDYPGKIVLALNFAIGNRQLNSDCPAITPVAAQMPGEKGTEDLPRMGAFML